jgi:hypothetical protein
MFRSNRIGRIRAVAVGVVVAATAAPFVVSDVAAASTASTPAGGTIHFYMVNTSIEGRSPADALFTGAFADHGTVRGATIRLSKGTITGNISKLEALTNSPKFATIHRASCSFSGVGATSIPLVRGTGAYAGISGTLKVRISFGAQSPSKDGKCEGNAAPLADSETITGSGKVSF